MQLNVSMQNCDERRNNLCILLRDASKRWDGIWLDVEMNVSTESGGLLSTMNICTTEVYTIDSEKTIIYKVVHLQTFSHLAVIFV